MDPHHTSSIVTTDELVGSSDAWDHDHGEHVHVDVSFTDEDDPEEEFAGSPIVPIITTVLPVAGSPSASRHASHKPQPVQSQITSDNPLFIPFISIPRTERLGDGKHSYAVYVIEVNDGARNEMVLRRYSQFDKLNTELRKIFTTRVFPSFPSKTVFRSMNKETLETRRAMLEKYLRELSRDDDIRNHSLFREFLSIAASPATPKTQPDTSAQWEGKCVCVVGASGGIGTEIACQYAGKGAVKLMLAGRRDDALLRVLDRCKLVGGKAEIYTTPADVSTMQGARVLFSTIQQVLGKLDVLVLCVGHGMHANFEDISATNLPGMLLSLTTENYFSAVHCTHFAAPMLKRTQGQLVCVSAVAGKLGAPGASLYSAAKHALHGFFDSLRCEDPGFGITLACPLLVRTEFWEHVVQADAQEGEVKIEQGKLMTPEECAFRIVEAGRTRQREVVLDTLTSVGTKVGTILPGVMDANVRHSVRALTVHNKTT